MSEGSWLAEVSWAGESVFLGSDTSGHTVVYDSGGNMPKGIGPMRALLTSLGACAGMDVVAILKKRRQRLASLRVLVSGQRPQHGLSKPWTSIHLRYVLRGEKLQRKYVEEAVRDSTEKFCSVGATLAPRARITHSYEILA